MCLTWAEFSIAVGAEQRAQRGLQFLVPEAHLMEKRGFQQQQ